MLRSLKERLSPSSPIAAFDIVRSERFQDGVALVAVGRRMGGIYLLGYFIEITLKCTFFRLFGFQPHEKISTHDLRAAAELAAKDLQVPVRDESLHSVQFWALAISSLREQLGAPLVSTINRELNWRSQRMHSNWSIAMRYSADISAQRDWELLVEDAQWLDSHYDLLVALEYSGAEELNA